MSSQQPGDSGRLCAEEWVPIDSLHAADSPRLDGESVEHVQVLALSGAVLPPIVVHRPSRRVIDGMHRLRAARLRGQSEILVRFFSGDDEDAFIIAVETNIAHGMPLSQADRIAAAARIVHARPGWSDRRVASVTGLSATTVGAIRRRSVGGSLPAGGPSQGARVGRDGRARPLDARAGRLLAVELLRERPQAPVREIADAAGVSPATALDVRRRLRDGEDPVPRRLGATQSARPVPSRLTLPVPAADGTPETQQADKQDPDSLDAATSADEWPAAALVALRNDPSLRFTDTGRALLRWLDARTGRMEEWRQHLDNIPPHTLPIVARLAQQNLVAWQEIIQYLETRMS